MPDAQPVQLWALAAVQWETFEKSSPMPALLCPACTLAALSPEEIPVSGPTQLTVLPEQQLSDTLHRGSQAGQIQMFSV